MAGASAAIGSRAAGEEDAAVFNPNRDRRGAPLAFVRPDWSSCRQIDGQIMEGTGDGVAMDDSLAQGTAPVGASV